MTLDASLISNPSPKAVKLRIDHEGNMSLDFDDADVAASMAECYGYECDDTIVELGHHESGDLPDVYVPHFAAQWERLAKAHAAAARRDHYASCVPA